MYTKEEVKDEERKRERNHQGVRSTAMLTSGVPEVAALVTGGWSMIGDLVGERERD